MKLSKCCGAKTIVVGTTTHYHVCTQCEKACDIGEILEYGMTPDFTKLDAMKIYRLLRPILVPNPMTTVILPIGTEVLFEDPYYRTADKWVFTKDAVENNPEWFEEMDIVTHTEGLIPAIIKKDKDDQMMSTVGPTLQDFKDMLETIRERSKESGNEPKCRTGLDGCKNFRQGMGTPLFLMAVERGNIVPAGLEALAYVESLKKA